jgi:D-sedoheptulose 7-phosphate isomerase
MTKRSRSAIPIAHAVTGFFEELIHGLAAVEVTDAAGAPMRFYPGMVGAVELIVDAHARGGKLLFVGNGASAAIASHQAVDYWKTARIRAMAFNDAALLTCISNDFGYASVFEKPLEMFAEARDVLVAISSSGRSENIIRAAHAARGAGARILTFSGFAPDNPLRSLGDLNFYVPTKSYGQVEVTHLSLSHCLLDAIVKVFGSPPTPPTGRTRR